MARALDEVLDLNQIEEGNDTIYSYCYEGSRRIVTDPDQENDGAPACDGQCSRCLL